MVNETSGRHYLGLGLEFFQIQPGLLSLGIIGITSLLTETAKVLTQDGGLPQVPSVSL